MTRIEKMSLAAESPRWMYEFDLGDGIKTPLLSEELRSIHDTRTRMLAALIEARYPRGLAGLRCLDVGCNEGYFSHWLHQRGAHVVGIDIREQNIRRARCVQKLLGLDSGRLEFHQSDFFTFAPACESYDIVLFLGLLYHLEHPMGALRRLRALTRGLCIVESQVTRQQHPIETGWGQSGVKLQLPASLGLHWEEHQSADALAAHGGVLSFIPNLPAVDMMLRSSGFEQVEQLLPEPQMNPQYVAGDRVMMVASPREKTADKENPMASTCWAAPRSVAGTEECYFYHTMEIPGHGLVRGEWDLRGRELQYLGHVDVRGKRVLEMGTASGHLCFTMEEMGAEVVAYDLSENQEWDIVPYRALDYTRILAERKAHMRRINNGYWFAHKARGSRARVVYGTAYSIPADIGQFDVCTFGSILLHLRDPFLALQRAAEHVRETMIVTDIVMGPVGAQVNDARILRFLPDAKAGAPTETWWHMTPELVAEFLHILGFPCTEISYHQQLFGLDRETPLYTVVGRR